VEHRDHLVLRNDSLFQFVESFDLILEGVEVKVSKLLEFVFQAVDLLEVFMETHVLFNRDFNFSVFPALIHVLDDQCNPLDVALTLTSMHTGDDRHQERFQVDFAIVIGLKSEKFVTD